MEKGTKQLVCPQCGERYFIVNLVPVWAENITVTDGVPMINGEFELGGWPAQSIAHISCTKCHFYIYHFQAEEKWKQARTPGRAAATPKGDDLDAAMVAFLKANPDIAKQLLGE